MKYKLTVNNQTYEVEIENIHARPIIVRLDGQQFEVLPEAADQAEVRKEAGAKVDARPVQPTPVPSTVPSTNPAISGNTLTAPLPGTVVSLFVKAGDKVEAGQVVLVIEAMKMKNSIRSLYSGKVGEVLINEGQSVAHKQALIKFADLGEASWM
ncbi:MAG TPA: biotin/lipoyl-binding protein [Anaerolineales bacterium]|nr:biotin/lipoyl-binding protein [Anaerolineales bacterium]HNN14781.1 biotin/lipoyl-binding protein [Anaerolineales bacterium]HNO31389.1 biotin/lipoyl-binding protein [Anaerolineales bacterium]